MGLHSHTFSRRLRTLVARKSPQLDQLPEPREDVSIKDNKLPGSLSQTEASSSLSVPPKELLVSPSQTETSSSLSVPPKQSLDPGTTIPGPVSTSQRLARTPKHGLGLLYEPPEPPKKPAATSETDKVLTKEQRKKKSREGTSREPQQRGWPRPIVDIVFVHGLTGSTHSTWLDKSGVYWPIDLLANDVRHARILAFGYDADVVNFWNPASQNRIGNHAENLLGALSRLREDTKSRERAIVFIAHSLGGLIVENALRLSRLSAEKHIQCLEPCVDSIIFLGSPHYGADLAGWATLGTNLTQLMKKTNKDIVSVLQPGSEMLAEVQRGFHVIMRLRDEEGSSISITCFYEELPLPIVGEVVPKHSATIPGYPAYGLHANHMDMTRFSSATNAGYQAILGELKIRSQKIRQSARTRQAFSDKDAACLRLFYESDYRAQRERSNLRIPGTCLWFLQHEKYLDWLGSPDLNFLWISGDPGCGKSVLASFIVTELQRHNSQTLPDSQICYFFFKDDNEYQRNATSALRAILHQILDHNHELIHFAHVQKEKKGSRFSQEFHALWDLLLTVTESNQSKQIVIILDALDECMETSRSLLMDALIKLYSSSIDGSSRGRIPKIIVTSRPYRSIELGFGTLARVRLKAEHETTAINEDIELVIKVKVKEIASSMNLKDSRAIALQDILIAKSDRTFLWVSLILKMIGQSIGGTDEEFQEVIDTLPTDLDATYEKILDKTPSRDKAKKILQIVVAAVRPLSLDEINIAQGIRPGMSSSKDLERYLLSDVGNSVKHLCGLFLRNIDSKIFLIHQTAREFLVDKFSTTPLKSGKWKHSLGWSESNNVMSKICVSYLLFDVFETHPLGWETYHNPNKKAWTAMSDQMLAAKYCKEHNFYHYAATYWAHHVREADLSEDSEVVDSALVLSNPHSRRFQSWLRTCQEPYLWDDFSSQKQSLTALMIASFYGHNASVKVLLEKVNALDELSANGRTALHMAAFNGHEVVSRLLVNAGANQNAQDADGLTPLYVAIDHGRKPVIHLLLTYGAEISTQTNLADTALHIAARKGHDDVVRALLGRNLVIDAKNKYGETPLHISARCGWERVARLLLQKEADPNILDDSQETALHLATRKGNASIVHLLWTHKVLINGVNENGETALHIAARSGNVELVRLLLVFGVEPNTRNALGQTALHLGSQSRNDSITKLLLEHSSETEVLFRNGWTALHLASFWGQTEIVELLLSAPCQLDHRNNDGDTALHLAVVEGFVDIVRLLLEYEADVDEDDICLAEDKGYVEIAESMRDASIKVKVSMSRSPTSPIDSIPDWMSKIT